jgi:hypothetical protein
MIIGGESKPSMRSPHSSLVEKFIGPRTALMPRSRSQSSARAISASAAAGSSSHSKKPKKPTLSPWNSMCR